MSLISTVGNKTLSQKALKIFIYSVLLFGAFGIIYPLLVVLGQTLSDRYDLRDNAIVPSYLTDKNEVLLKHIFNKRPNSMNLLASRHNRNQWGSQSQMRADRKYFEKCEAIIKEQGFSLDNWNQVAEDFSNFKLSLNVDELLASIFGLEDYYRPFLKNYFGGKATALMEQITESKAVPGWLKDTFQSQAELDKVCSSHKQLSLTIMNHELRGNYLNFHNLELLPSKNFLVPFWRPGDSPKENLWRKFKQSLPPQQLLLIPADAYWHAFLKSRYRVIKNLNSVWKKDYDGFYEITMPTKYIDSEVINKDYKYFVRKRWPRRLLVIKGNYNNSWRNYVYSKLKSKHIKNGNTENIANIILGDAAKLTGKRLSSWDNLTFPEKLPANKTLALYWSEFTSLDIVDLNDMKLQTPLAQFHEYLLKTYGPSPERALAAINKRWGSNFRSFEELPLPLIFSDFIDVKFHIAKLRFQFATESFKRVWSYLFGRGRAVWNTLLLVVLSLLSALTINPIAAYSLSRFPMKQTNKILIFFLATMAFPAEVAMIPNFLLLRDLGMLNTYAALILPGMANGFSIFLLKGFFDSLPQELYQAAEIDGASELQIFRLVAVPMIKPILAYIGLGTFVAVYGGFMWALVICPDPKMWTLMVWVYDFQTNNPGNNYIMAATILVSIPPLIVFLFANKIIMRGIIIPAMK